ncbi:SIR2 family NAD-dependent protein deacylase [Gluconacetobacter johannae]|uniref:SIR2 family protein n=1 Tax=Gluconacetobacter johannae TaxID=112140 RepID=A0A7W4P344_9PROT|nr:SIR2 family protein [Gluconacetobacter johannae]MBB2175647.1 SIR2 family protein [Gluconacetobacter johannae]
MSMANDLLDGMRAGHLVPYLGPGATALAAGEGVPVTPEGLATFMGQHVALPRRARGNPWAAGQYIESSRHRATLIALMDKAYENPVPPGSLHLTLAGLRPTMIVDTWYDGAMRAALQATPGKSWGEIQGITRAGIGEARWFRAYRPDGTEAGMDEAEEWHTILYKPHGAVTPDHNYLVADSDYVEVLTEIDIQTPIPDIVRRRRTNCGFVFLGCRFNDQMLRIYARQILKRSTGPNYAIVDPGELTRNEQRLFDDLGVTLVPMPLAQVQALLAAG